MMKTKTLFVSVLVAQSLLLASAAYAEKCEFVPDQKSLSVEWTAYKTTEKTAVGGQFKDLKVTGAKKFKTLKGLIQGLKVEVSLASPDTGNPARDKTLTDYFFAKLKGAKAEGRLSQYDEKKQSAQFTLTLNKKKQTIPVQVVAENGTITVTGEMDILKFGGQTAFDSLHEKCLDLHKGKDGVSKTWSTVDLKFKGSFAQNCK